MDIPEDVFKVIVVCFLGLGIVTYIASSSDFERTLGFAKTASIYSIIGGIIIFIIILLVKRVYEQYQFKKMFSDSTTKKELPETTEQCKTKEEPKESVEQSKTNVSFKAQPERQTKKEDYWIDLDYDVKFYNARKLNVHEIEYLKNRDFIIRSNINPFTKKYEIYIFKKNDNEGEKHFLITNLIVEFLQKKVDNLKTYITVKPDIVFETNGKKIALEIESGNVLKHNKKNLLAKVKSLNQNYDDWFFVVTNRNLATKYRKYGRVIDLRYLKNQLEKVLRK